MSKYYFIIIFMVSFSQISAQQGISNIWLQGYDSDAGAPPWGINRINFISGSPVIVYDSLGMEFNHTLANISDSLGNLLFYTNGVYIADATNDTMQNGSGINPGAYSLFVPDGHLIAQGALILKKPGNNNSYYIFHNTLDNYPSVGAYAYQLYLTEIDMNSNGGLGAVVNKNYPVISDTLNTGKLSATRHANGRDWWVVCHRVNSNMYYKLLVTPYGLQTVSSQNIGSVRQWDAGQAKFSSNGSKYSYYHYYGGLDIMDFDRCTGQFSNCVTDVSLPFIPGNVGCEISPNSQFLYVTNIEKVYQYDITSTNILATKTIVAEWDTFSQPGIPQLRAYLCIPQLAPDGKIYITTGNSTTYMGRINNPDSAGLSCDVAQHSVLLPAYYFNTLPNHPNYFLGKIPGSLCDTISGVGLEEEPEIILKVYPNPTAGKFTLSFPVQKIAGEMEIYDVNGSMVRSDYVAPWSQFKHSDVSELREGIYFVKMRWGDASAGIKLIISNK